MFLVIYAFILGAVFASFIEAYATRLLNNESIITPRSHCDKCGHTLKWYELIPILSYIILGGKCSNCHEKIDKNSFIGEIIIAMLFAVTYLIKGLSYETFIGFIVILVTYSIVITDFKKMIILDSTILFGIIFILLFRFLDGGIWYVYHSFLTGIFGFVLMFVIKILGDALFKRDSLGGGDIKLAFLMGLLVDANLFLVILLIASTVALPYALYIGSHKSNHELPFGPFLIFSAYIVYMFAGVFNNLLNLLIIE